MVAARLYKLRATNAVSFDDYLQYARTGLLEAVDRFDPTRGVRFESFASARIRGAILTGLESETELAAQQKYRGTTCIAERLESLRDPLNDKRSASSLEGWVSTVVSVAMGLLLERDDAEHPADESINANPYASIEILCLRRKLLGGVKQLPEREAEVIRLHYFEHREFQIIAEELKVSKGRVSQLHARALMRLKQTLSRTVVNSEL
jgi:RNA polymerase sigma factor for flagellar operon FliA